MINACNSSAFSPFQKECNELNLFSYQVKPLELVEVRMKLRCQQATGTVCTQSVQCKFAIHPQFAIQEMYKLGYSPLSPVHATQRPY